jgi:hypothetical protein
MAKGAKECPACGHTVGCRSHECECGHVFKTAIAGTEEHERAQEEPGFFPVSGYAIIAPAGRCPVTDAGRLAIVLHGALALWKALAVVLIALGIGLVPRDPGCTVHAVHTIR